MDLEFGHQEQIQNAQALIGLLYDDRASGFGPRKEVRVLDIERPTIAHVNGEWLKGLRPMEVSELLDRHAGNYIMVGGPARRYAIAGTTT